MSYTRMQGSMDTDPFEVKAVQSYKARKKNELTFKTDQVITVTKTNVKEFLYYGKLEGKEGWFPYFYVKSLENKQASNSLRSTAKPEEHHNPIHSVAHKIATSKRKEKIKKDYVLKSGMLGKQITSSSNVAPMYKQRWAVLRIQRLNFYRSAVDQKTLGKLSVKNFKSVDYDATASKGSKLFCFTITTKKKESLTFACKGNDECDEWVKMIRFAIAGGKPNAASRVLAASGKAESKRETIIRKTPSAMNVRKQPSTISGAGQRKLNPSPAGRLQRQMTLKKIENHLQSSPGTPGAEEIIKRIQKIKASFDPATTPSCDDIELDDITIPSRDAVGRARALFNYVGRSEFELTIRINDEILLLGKESASGWCLGLLDHREGYFPFSHVKVIELFEVIPKTPDTPQRTRARSNGSQDGKEKKEKEKEKEKERKNVSLLENFQIGERIGKGQYGSVYRGINVDNGEMVAIKQVSIYKMKKPEIASIMGELELLKELDHINILSYKTFIRTKEHINIVLDFVEGGSLASILGKFGVIPEKLAVCYIKQILDGLEYLHAREVIHRDIKCGNILVTKDGSVKLADFGIAMKLGDPSAPAVGSPYWMAPEVIEMRGSSSACDIWALGCTIIELLTGQPPYFEFNQVQAMFCMVENERPPFPQDISPDMESFLSLCFKRDPVDRATAKQLKRHVLVGGAGDIEETQDFDLDGLDMNSFGDSYEIGGDLHLDGLDVGNLDFANLEGILDSLQDTPDQEESSELTSDTDFDDDLEGLDVDGIDFQTEGVNEEDLTYLADDKKTQELLNWFHDAMDKGSVTHAIRIRKSVRNKLQELKKQSKNDPRYEILVQQVTIAMDRCEDEMGQYIPVDSDGE